MAAVLGHAGAGDVAGRRPLGVAEVIGAHLAYLCAAAFCATAAALLAVLAVGLLVGGGAAYGLACYALLVTAVAFLLGVPYAFCGWWRFMATGRDDWAAG